MKKSNKLFLLLSLLGLITFSQFVASCSDEIAEGEYITLYEDESNMMDKYLKNNPNYSMFTEIVEKSGYMDLLSAYGKYTCFAPTNQAVQNFLQKRNYASIDQITDKAVLDTIVLNHIIDERYFVNDLITFANDKGMINQPTLLKKRLDIKITTVDAEDGTPQTTFIVNGSSTILYNACNDSVGNGVVHGVDCIIEPATIGLLSIIKDNPDFSIMYEAIERSGFVSTYDEAISVNVEKAKEWKEVTRPKYVALGYEDAYLTGGSDQWDYCHLPEDRLYGYTAFLPSNDVLSDKYGISKDDPQHLQKLYDLAQKLYGVDNNINIETATTEEMKGSALHKFVSYHFLDRMASYDRLTCNIGIRDQLNNPVTYYGTFMPHSLIKFMEVTVNGEMNAAGVPNGTVFVNRSTCRYIDGERESTAEVRGARIFKSTEMSDREKYEYKAKDGYLYYIDDIIYWSDKNHQNDVVYNGQTLKSTQTTVFNERMRMDLYTLFPEMMNNEIRNIELDAGRALNPKDPSPNQTIKNWIFPNGYLDGVKINDDGHFFYQGAHQGYWAYHGDEYNLQSNNGDYDITIPLPAVPEGTYQLRLGFANMPTRGICQFYFDGEMVGLPFDMRSDGFNSRSSWQNYTTLKDRDKANGTDELETVKKEMHNKGWWHGPMGCGTYSISNGVLGISEIFGEQARTSRYLLGNKELQITEGKKHNMRIKRIWGGADKVVMLDYIELVPKSVYADGENAEDDY